MRRNLQDELKTIEEAYLAGRQLADAGSLEAAILCFDQVLVRLPRRRRDRVYRIERGSKSAPLPGDIQWLPAIFRDALLAKAFCLNELGRFRAASKVLERAVELDPDNPRIYVELGFIHGSQDHMDEARAAFSRAALLEPQNADHLRALVHILLLTEQFDEARDLSLDALTIDPSALGSWHHLAYAEYRLEHLDEAVRALEHAVELAPTDLESIMRLAGTLRDCERIREAIVCLETFLRAVPGEEEALTLMTELLQQDSAAPELIPHAHRLLLANPRDTVALDLLAWGGFQQARFNIALGALRRLVVLEPTQSYHWFKLGMVYQALGNLEQAMASYLRALGLSENSDIHKATMEAVSLLDQVQLEQVFRRAAGDPEFRYRLRVAPDRTLRAIGFLLSPVGLEMLHTMEMNDDTTQMMRQPTPTTN